MTQQIASTRTDAIAAGTIDLRTQTEHILDRLRQRLQLGKLQSQRQVAGIRVVVVHLLEEWRCDPGMQMGAHITEAVTQHVQQRSTPRVLTDDGVVHQISRNDFVAFEHTVRLHPGSPSRSHQLPNG